MPAPSGDDFPHNLPPPPVVSLIADQQALRPGARGDDVEQGHLAALELQAYPPPRPPPRDPRDSLDQDAPTSSLLNPSRHRHETKQDSPSNPDPDDNSSLESDAETPMNQRKTRSKRASQPNGHTDAEPDSDSANGDMNMVEHRRKPAAANGGNQADAIINSESFSLDEDLPNSAAAGSHDGSESAGFWQLPAHDRRNFVVLVMLYFLQGVPLGLAGGSVPFLLKTVPYRLSYAQLGIFSLALYPYSLKLLWSPIIDAVWSPKIGRRKSWIIPVQAVSGLGMLFLGSRAEKMMIAAGSTGGSSVWGFTLWWFLLVFTCATQDIAVDGWAITLLSHKHLAYASTAQTVGLTGGQFLSYTVFLAFESPEFANKWFREKPLQEGVMTLGGYLTFWGWVYLLVTIGLALFKHEERSKTRESIWEVYKLMYGILKLKNVQALIVIHLIAKIGFQANDAVTNLKLLDKGFSQEDLALTVLIDFPFELSLGYYAGKWSSQYPPMHLWCWAFIGRLIAAGFAQFVVMLFPAGGVTTGYLILVIVEHIFSTFMMTVMFVAVAAFHAKIADPAIGGTYMTMLATASNLGGTFPRYFVLGLVDWSTRAMCRPPSTMSAAAASTLRNGATPVTKPFACVLDADKRRCTDGGGSCNTTVDGYYIVNVACILFGTLTFFAWIRPKSMQLQALPLKAWRLVADTAR